MKFYLFTKNEKGHFVLLEKFDINPLPCQHVWKTINQERFERISFAKKNLIDWIAQRCQKCGEVKKQSFEL